MKKRMFNDNFRLTDLVIQGRKTMTSDILPELGKETKLVGTNEKGDFEFRIGDNYNTVAIKPKFKVGEVVAVAQRYDTLYQEGVWSYATEAELIDKYSHTAGWCNKMFVRPDLMPHQIRIKKVKCEKLQQISEEDMIKEGVIRYAKPFDNNPYLVERFTYRTPGVNHSYNSPLMAFLRIIGDIFGRDTWLNNPYRISYEFTLIK